MRDELRTGRVAHALDDQFGAVLDAVADGVTVEDRSGRVVYANAAAVRLIGFGSADEVLAAETTEILARFELFDGAGNEVPISALPGRLALEGVAEPEATVGFRIRATGEERWATVRSTPLRDEDGTVRFAITTFHDITDRVQMEAAVRASEARYRQLDEAMPQIAWMTDRTGAIVLVDRRSAEYTGDRRTTGETFEIDHRVHADDRLNAVIRTMGDGLIVCDASGAISLANPAAGELFHGSRLRTYADLLEHLDDPDAIAPRLGARGGPIELRVRAHDAQERWVEVSSFPVGSPDLATKGEDETIVLLRDVTLARQRQVVRDAFLGVLSHELRTPITTIFAASKILARPDSSLAVETQREMFEDIRLEAERLHRLVEDVIALTRFGDEQGDVGNEPVLLQRILPGVVTSETARWPAATFTLAIPIGLPTVVADPTYVEQVVRNLLSNAAKYGGVGVRIDVVAETTDEEVTVRIVDDGPGFPADEAERLFERFFRSPTTAGRSSGAGIGLFVCARLIHAMGGRIWALPRPTGGAEFGFSLRVMAEA